MEYIHVIRGVNLGNLENLGSTHMSRELKIPKDNELLFNDLSYKNL